MKLTKYAIYTLFPLTLALFSGCALKKKSADATAPAAAAAETPASKPAREPAPPVFQDVTIRSVPSGARVLLDGAEVGVTPLMAKLNIASRYDLTLLLPNYLANTRTIQKSGVVAGGISLGKTGLSSHAAPGLPSEVKVSLSVDKDPVKGLSSAIKALDSQLKAGQITPAIYKAKLAEVTRFYSASK